MWKMTNISALDVFHEKDERENREVLESYRGEDAGDLERSELNELVENWRYVNDPGRRNWKINEKSWKTWRGNQKMVMDEDKVQNGVMDEKFVKNFVMGAKIDPKVVMDLSVFKIGGWNILQSSNRKLSEEFINENEPRLSIRIPSRDSCFMIQYLEQPFVCDNLNVKESKPICEDLHEMMQCYRQQHSAASNDLHEHLRRHSLRKDSLKIEYSRMRSESSECTWNAKTILIHLDSYLEECAQEVWERDRMSPDLHTTWWSVKIRKVMEIILMLFREQFEEDDQMNTVRKPVILIPDTLREWELTLRERGGFWE